MDRWQYCELHWRAEGVTVKECDAYGQHKLQDHALADFHTVLALLGSEGWELVSVLGSPKGVHEYWYYFKRAGN
jgi:hypothetical protein